MTDYIGPKTPRKSVYNVANRVRPTIPPRHLQRLPILAFDPGGTTGWSLLILNPKCLEGDDFLACIKSKNAWFHGEIDCLTTDLHQGIWEMKRMIDLYPSAAVVFEDFWVRQMSVDLSPHTIISAVSQHLWEQKRTMFKQSASQAKTMATDERLKLWGCYQRTGGLGHARDADRHALLFVRKLLGHKGSALRKEIWPHVYGKTTSDS